MSIVVVRHNGQLHTHTEANDWLIKDGALVVTARSGHRHNEFYIYAPGQWTAARKGDYDVSELSPSPRAVRDAMDALEKMGNPS